MSIAAEDHTRDILLARARKLAQPRVQSEEQTHHMDITCFYRGR